MILNTFSFHNEIGEMKKRQQHRKADDRMAAIIFENNAQQKSILVYLSKYL